MAALAGFAVWLCGWMLFPLHSILLVRPRMLELCDHLAIIYVLQWLLKLILFWPAIAHPRPKLPQTLTIAELLLSSLLFIIAGTTRRNSKMS
jgi:hypothetical protein